MISNVFLDKSKEKIISLDYIDYLVILETLNYLKKENLIDISIYDKMILQIKKTHIGN